MIEPRFSFGLPLEAKAIRQEVFINEQGFKDEFDEFDQKSWHLVLFYNAFPIATGRFYFEDPETVHLGRIAVLPSFRGKKIGTYLVKFLITKSKTLGARKAILLAQYDKRFFYERIGFKEDPNGEIVMDEGCPHIYMEMEYAHKSKRKKRFNFKEN